MSRRKLRSVEARLSLSAASRAGYRSFCLFQALQFAFDRIKQVFNATARSCRNLENPQPCALTKRFELIQPLSFIQRIEFGCDNDLRFGRNRWTVRLQFVRNGL